MTDRERLIDLLDQKQYLGFATVNGTNYIQNAKVADYLIANGVVVIPSKGCEYCKGRGFSTITTIDGRTIKLPFDFCPKCGRRIKNDMKQGDKI